MVEAYTRWIIRWRYLVVLLSVACVLAAGYGASRLSVQNDYRMFFGKDNPQLLAFERMQNTFNKNDNILFVITPKGGDVFTREVLAAVKTITEEAWQIPYSTRVDSITNFQHTYAEEDDLIVGDLVPDPAALDQDDLERIRNIAINEPNLINRLISPDSSYTGVNVVEQLPENNVKAVPEAVDFARDLKQRMLEQFPNIEIRLVGLTVMNNAFPEASKEDVKNLYPLALAFILVVLLFLLRGLSGTVTTLFIILFSIIAAMGMAGWFGIKLSPPSFSAPIMILTMSVADAVHLLVTMRHEMVVGMQKDDAMVESMRINFNPVFITSLTTVLGFLSLNFSDAPPFHDLGNIAAMGVATAFFLSVTFLPAMTAILPATARSEVVGMKSMSRFGTFVIANRNKLFYGSAIVSVALIAMIPRNELNDVFVEYFDTAIEFRRDSDYAAEHLTGVYYMDYALRAKEAGGISEPEFLRQVEIFAQHMRERDEVIHVQSVTDTFKRLNRNMHGDDPAYYRLPEERDLAAQYLLLYEMSLPYGLDLNNQIDVQKSATRVAVTLETLSTNEILALEDDTIAWMHDNTPDIEFDASGPTLMFAHIGKRNIHSMLVGTTVALVLISAVLIIFLKSVKYGLLSLLPNLLPAGVGFGIWGLLVGEVGLALSVVTGMTLGIIVDDTVHFLSKYLRARREKGYDAEQAVQYAFNSVGVALVVTTIVLVAGFMILAQSHFEINSGMGLLTSLVIVLALVIDFLLLPPLLIYLSRKTA